MNIMNNKVEKKKTKGKNKIAIEAIKNKTQMQVTFSKRRGGLFKKASELCILCGVNIAIFTFSPAGKLFSFGHPSAEAVIQRYINNAINCNNNSNSNNKYFCKGVEEYMDTISQIEAEKKASTSSNNNSNNGRDYYGNGNYYNGGFWWDKNIDNLGLIDLQHFKIALEGLRDEVVTRVDEINRLLSMSIVPHQNIEFGSRDGNIVAHCKNIDRSNYTSHWNDQSLMSVVSQNIDVGTRDGNTDAHSKKIDGSTSCWNDQSLMSVIVGTRDKGNNVAHYQGFDESS